jgi:hypothetical protein
MGRLRLFILKNLSICELHIVHYFCDNQRKRNMARNQEKAQSMLYRFREAEMAELGLSQQDKRPPHTKLATTLAEAEKWRGQVIREITRKVSRIHDRSY